MNADKPLELIFKNEMIKYCILQRHEAHYWEVEHILNKIYFLID